MSNNNVCVKENEIEEIRRDVNTLKIDNAINKENISAVKTDIKEMRIEIKESFAKIESKNNKIFWIVITSIIAVITQIITELIKK